MVMNPKTHPRGAPPDFQLPEPNPDPARMTDALWWLVCMRMRLSSQSRNGGTYAYKAGSHNTGQNLLNHTDSRGVRIWEDDHSIRHEWNRTGPWWQTKCSAHDWTFADAQSGDYSTISLYTRRLINSMRDPDDLRPDQVVFYTLGQTDNDRVVEGYHELNNDELESNDLSHLWHRHDSFFRNVIGSFSAMWKVLTIDIGWTYDEWLRSVTPQPEEEDMTPQEMIAVLKSAEGQAALLSVLNSAGGQEAIRRGTNQDTIRAYDNNAVPYPIDPARPGDAHMTRESALTFTKRDTTQILLKLQAAREEIAVLRAEVAALHPQEPQQP